MTKNRLGRGLSALIPSYTSADESFVDGAVALKNIVPNRNQPRQDFAKDKMNELINSIRESGILQPITVREMGDGKYEIVAGERRFRAATSLGLETVPVYIIDVNTDVEMLEYAIVENVQRDNLNPIEEAEGYALLSGKYGLIQEDIAKKVGKSRVSVTNSLRLLKLPPEIKNSLKNAEITAGHARAILGLRKSMQMISVFHRILRDKLSVRQTEELVKKLHNISETNPKKSRSTKKLPVITEFENQMLATLGTKTSILRKNSGKGKISIEFYSDDDLERIIDLILNIEKI
jgi:ParB family transcriptional regulator, chromosome partitioning protein